MSANNNETMNTTGDSALSADGANKNNTSSDVIDITSPGAPVDDVRSVCSDGGASVASSVANSVSSVRSGIPKLSFVKKPATASGGGGGELKKPPTPTKIGRPCVGVHSPKPPLPPPISPSTTSSADGYEESYRRVTDELNRYRLTDVQEADEYEEDYNFRSFYSANRNRYSSFGSTGSSMDALWELHPRRLSEAGLSRYSDNSTILTEDTDSFIIGQRVWVAGTKPGHIAYIGDTQFAPGEWAGIVLDQPIGKNDGSVSGHQYFQCEPKKGIFSRLTRLTRFPLSNAGEMGSGDSMSVSSGIGGGRKITDVRRSPMLRSQTPLSTSNSSLSSAVAIDYKLGDRVIVSSSQGSKVGTLRYIGFTAFANGEWCGVELDNPVGKNDGSVQGKRYFECAANYGVFAPIAKVSKSPSKTKPGNCVIHSSPGSNTNLRRVNSRESLASMSSSIISSASGMRRVRLGVNALTPKKSLTTPPKSNYTPVASRMALQDELKEKQQHIERLLKERNLERAEITRAASQADNAEQKLNTVKQEYENYRTECDVKLKEHLELLSKLKQDRTELVTQLEDEKRKNEDLQFKFEEAAITRVDVENKVLLQAATNESYLTRINELETQLNQERRNMETLEGESLKEGSLLKAELLEAKEQVETLKSELENAMTKNSLLTSAEATTTGHSEELKSQLENYKVQLEQQQKENIKSQDELNQKLTSKNSEFEMSKFTLSQEIEGLKLKLEAEGSNITEKSEAITNLKTDLEVVNKSLEEKVKELELIRYQSSNSEVGLNKEIEKLKMEISAKVHDNEAGVELVEKHQKEMEELQEKYQKSEGELVSVKEIFEKEREELKELQVVLSRDLEEFRNSSQEKTKELEELKLESSKNLQEKTLELENLVKERNNELGQIKMELEQAIELSKKSEQEISQTLQNQISEANKQLEASNKTLESKSEEITKLTTTVTSLEETVANKIGDNEKLSNDFATLQSRFEESMSELAKANESVNSSKLEIGDFQRKLQGELEKVAKLTESKLALEQEIQNLLNTSGDDSARLEQFNKELRDKDKVIERMSDEFSRKQQESQHGYQELEITVDNLRKDGERVKLEFEESVKKLLEVERGLREKLDSDKIENRKLVEEIEGYKKELTGREGKMAELVGSVGKSEEELKTAQSKIGDLESSLKSLLEVESSLKESLVIAQRDKDSLEDSRDKVVKDLQEGLSKVTKELEEVSLSKVSLGQELAGLKEATVRESEVVAGLLKDKEIRHEEKIKEFEKVEKELREQLEEATKSSQVMGEDLSTNISKLQKDLASKTIELAKAMEDGKIKERGFSKEKKELAKELSSKLQESETKLNILNNELSEYKETIAKKSTELAELKGKAMSDNSNWDLKENQLKLEMQEKIKLAEMKYAESQSKLDALQTELDSAKKDCNSNVIHASVKDKEIISLTTKVNELSHTVERVQKEKDEIKSLAVSEGKQSAELSNARLAELSGKVSEMEAKISSTESLREEFEVQRNNYAQVVDLLNLTEKQKQNLVKQLEETVNAKAQSSNCAELLSIVKKIQVNNTDVRKIMELQQQVESTEKLLEDSKKEMKKKEYEVTELKNTLSKALKPVETKVEPVIPDDNAMKLANGSKDNANYKQLLEEKLFVESQVQFLNSIIVDMKKKSDEQEARIKILECGYGTDVADEILQMGPVQRRDAPRKYCDICQEFDIHETEDCPIQGSEEMPPPPPPTGEARKRKIPEPRPYCEYCEVFGHNTEDCSVDDTF